MSPSNAASVKSPATTRVVPDRKHGAKRFRSADLVLELRVGSSRGLPCSSPESARLKDAVRLPSRHRGPAAHSRWVGSEQTGGEEISRAWVVCRDEFAR